MDFRNYIPEYVKAKDGEYTYKFTVFTPVYNVQQTIERTHEALKKQTYKDFEWLIVNDGSTDETDQVIKEFQKTSPLNINYINNKKNQHKMACFMQAIDIADGEFFLTLDGDDECFENALEVFNEEYNDIPEKQKDNIIAVTVSCVDQNGEKVGMDFPTTPYYRTPFELSAVDKVNGEKWGFTKTDALRGVKYSDAFVNTGFMSLSMVWNLLGKESGRTKYVNRALRIYHIGVENSISGSSKKKRAIGLATSYIAKFNMFFKDYFYKAPLFFLKNLYLLLSISVLMDLGIKDYLKSIDSFRVKFFFTIFWPFRRLMKFPY